MEPGGPGKKHVTLLKGRPVRFHVDWWEGTSPFVFAGGCPPPKHLEIGACAAHQSLDRFGALLQVAHIKLFGQTLTFLLNAGFHI